MSREKLPNRRRAIADSIFWPPQGGRRVHVRAGLAADGRVLECFLRGGGRTGSDADHLLDDAAVLISRLLQFGDTLTAIRAGLGRLPDGQPASVIGAAIDKLVQIEAERDDA